MTKIEKQIHKELQYFLDEFDISAEIKRLSNSKNIEEIIKREIKDKVERAIGNTFIKAFAKNQKLIDSFAENKLRNLLEELGIK